jgi:hypothetical protein
VKVITCQFLERNKRAQLILSSVGLFNSKDFVGTSKAIIFDDIGLFLSSTEDKI